MDPNNITWESPTGKEPLDGLVLYQDKGAQKMFIPYWLRPNHWRYIIRYVLLGYVQRAYRGWADVDTWSYDHYLARTIPGALRRLAQYTNGYPPFILDDRPDLLDADGTVNDTKAFEAWQHWLIEKATWFEWYAREDMNLEPGMTDDQKHAAIDLYERQHKQFQEVVLVDFSKHFESLWD